MKEDGTTGEVSTGTVPFKYFAPPGRSSTLYRLIRASGRRTSTVTNSFHIRYSQILPWVFTDSLRRNAGKEDTFSPAVSVFRKKEEAITSEVDGEPFPSKGR